MKHHWHEPWIPYGPGDFFAARELFDVGAKSLVNCRGTLDDLPYGISVDLHAVVCVVEARCLRNVAEVQERVSLVMLRLEVHWEIEEVDRALEALLAEVHEKLLWKVASRYMAHHHGGGHGGPRFKSYPVVGP